MKKKIFKKPIKRKTAVLSADSLIKKGLSEIPNKHDFENAVALICSELSVLRKEMNEKFEKHENIILAEYRHRIEDLEGKVRKLMEK